MEAGFVLPQDEVRRILNDYGPNSYTQLGRPNYCTLGEDRVREFLFRTQYNRVRWNEAQYPSGDIESVCTWYAFVGYGKMEEYRVMEKQAPYPYAAFVTLLPPKSVGELYHLTVSFINHAKKLQIIEVETDMIVKPPADIQSFVGQ